MLFYASNKSMIFPSEENNPPTMLSPKPDPLYKEQTKVSFFGPIFLDHTHELFL